MESSLEALLVLILALLNLESLNMSSCCCFVSVMQVMEMFESSLTLRRLL